jgi:predicted transcriptional regulator
MTTRTIDLPDQLAEALRIIAGLEHRSVQQTLVVAAEEYVQRHEQRARIAAATDKVKTLDSELLERLGR